MRKDDRRRVGRGALPDCRKVGGELRREFATSSIGVAGVPGASIATTTMLLDILGIPAQGLILIMIPDRILDMCRTATNITGDAAVAVLVAFWEGWLGKKEEEMDIPED